MTRFLLKGTLGIVLPLLILEGLFRILAGGPLAGIERLVDFYQPVAAHVDTARVDVMLVGNSRVAASIDAAVFAEAITASTERPAHVLNVGQGYATPATHYFALTRLIDQYPDRFRGVTVLVEARDGLPDEATWTDEWAHPEWPTLLSPVIPASALPGFWIQSANEAQTKALVTASSAFRSIRLWTFIRARIQHLLSGAAETLASGLTSPAAPGVAAGDNPDLTDAGGIRTDSAGVALARKRALAATDGNDGHIPLHDWSTSVWADLHRALQAAGGHLAFFDVPMSSVDRAAFDGPSFNESRMAFAAWREAHRIALLQPSVSFDDTVFPDYYHLATSASASYTQSLAEAFVSDSY